MTNATARYIFHNEQIIKSTQEQLNTLNALAKGYLFSEQIRSRGTVFFFLNEHIENIKNKLASYQIAISNDECKKLINNCERIINSNKYFAGIIIEIIFYFDTQIQYLISTAETTPQYTIPEKGMLIDVMNIDNILPNPDIALAKQINQIIELKNREVKVNDYILTNQHNEITGSVNGAIFLVKNQQLFTSKTPSLFSFPIITNWIYSFSLKNNITIIDNRIITTADLLIADEIFVANHTEGFKWIVGYQQKRYFNKTSKLFTHGLNTELNIK